MGGGGGGGGGYSPTSSVTRIRELEQLAREALEKPVTPRVRRRVFLSFRGEDVDTVNAFRAQARSERSGLDFIDFSLTAPIQSRNEELIKRAIKARIVRCSVTVVLIGKTTHQSRFVDWEIEESIRLGKGVIAVTLPSGVGAIVPPAIERHGVKVLPWNNKVITDEIGRAAEPAP